MKGSRATSSSDGAGQIIEAIREHQPVSAEELLRRLSDSLPAGLSDTQKLARIHNQLRHLVDVGQIRNQGSRRYPRWGLVE